MKPTDRLKLDAIPVFDQDVQTFAEFIEVLRSYLIDFHNVAKDIHWQSMGEAKEFFRFMVKNSSEPQYRLIRTIAFAEALNEYDLSSNEVISIFSDLKKLDTYRNSLIQTTYQQAGIRATVEACYSLGWSAGKTVDYLIEKKVLAEYNEKNEPNRDSHLTTTNRYYKAFKSFDVERESK